MYMYIRNEQFEHMYLGHISQMEYTSNSIWKCRNDHADLVVVGRTNRYWAKGLWKHGWWVIKANFKQFRLFLIHATIPVKSSQFKRPLVFNRVHMPVQNACFVNKRFVWAKRYTATPFLETLKCFEHGPLARYVKLRVAHAPGMPGTFSPPPISKETAS